MPARTASPPAPSPWLTKREAAAYLRISVDTLNRWHRLGIVTFYGVEELKLVRRLKKDELDNLRLVDVRNEVRIDRNELDALHRPVERDPS